MARARSKNTFSSTRVLVLVLVSDMTRIGSDAGVDENRRNTGQLGIIHQKKRALNAT